MICEPLKYKKQKMIKEISKTTNKKINDDSDFYLGFKKGVDESFNVFNSYIDLFKRYKNNVKLLMDEQNTVWSKWVKYYENHSNIDTSNYLEKYNDWLFDYIFSDINTETSNLLNL